MGKVRTFRGSRDNIVRPLGLGQKIKAEKPEVVEIVSDDPNGEPIELVGEFIEQLEDGTFVDEDGNPVEFDEGDIPVMHDGDTVEVEDDETEDVESTDEDEDAEPSESEIDLDGMDKTELQAFAEKHGIDSSGRIDHLRARIAKSLKEG